MEGLQKQNFIQEDNFEKNEKPHWSRFFLLPLQFLPQIIGVALLGILIVVIVVVVSALPYLDSIRTVSAEALNARDNLESFGQYLEQKDFITAKERLEEANNSLFVAEQELQELKQKTVFKLPVIKKEIELAEDLLVIGSNTTKIVNDIFTVSEEVLVNWQVSDKSFSEISEEERTEILKKMVEIGEVLKESNIEINQIDYAYSDFISKGKLGFWSSIEETVTEIVPAMLKGFEAFTTISDIMPSLVGFEQEKVYLFILQNNDELRPSGGFIGTYGIMKVKNGDLKSFETDNIYNLDVNIREQNLMTPPEPIKDHLGMEEWFMRDSNWWPDFPTSAQKVEEFYHLEGGPEENIDGVIAINPNLIEDLMGLVGDITVEGITFTKENFTDELQYQVEVAYFERGGEIEGDRKNIIGTLSKELENRLFNLPISKFEELFDVVSRNLIEKFVQIYVKDTDLQKYFENKKWSGKVEYTPDDYLMVVDANLAALKTDRVMNREVKYKLVEKDGSYISEVNLTYINNGFFDYRTTRYRSYTRVYVPETSELIELKIGNDVIKNEDVDFYREFGKTAYGFFFEVEPKQRKTITLKYKLPQAVYDASSDGDYKLLVQKQAGVKEWKISLDLQFERDLRSFAKKEKRRDLMYDGSLKVDELFNVLFD